MAIKTLVLGFGGTGATILTYLKELAVFKHGRKPDSLAFVEFDTIETNLWNPGSKIDPGGTSGGEETIAIGRSADHIHLDRNTEYFHLRDGQPSLRDHVLNLLSQAGPRERFPHLKDWLHADWLSKIVPPASLNIVIGAGQQRQIGRFAMFANVEPIKLMLEKTFRELSRAEPGPTVNIWIVGSAAGGTGAGCIIDAACLAYLTAHQMNMTPTLFGAIVLPDVYADAKGVSKARAFSFFRELERFQEIDIPHGDRYNRDGRQISSEIIYDSRQQIRATIESRLFDYLIYLGDLCDSNDKREAFFNSVANAIDPFVDANVGKKMMENIVNTTGKPFSFGGARLSIPLTTYAELFAWELVEHYLVRLVAPKSDGAAGFVTGVHSGTPRDRDNEARDRVRRMSYLCDELLQKAELDDKGLDEYVNQRLSPVTIIRDLYRFGTAGIAGIAVSDEELDAVVPLAFANPFLGRTGAPDEIAADEVAIKTYQENRRVKRGIRESQDESRDRFAGEIREVLEGFLADDGSEGSFEQGRRLVRRRITEALFRAADQAVEREFAIERSIVGDHERPEQGTPFTRLYAELRALSALEGPLGVIGGVLDKILVRLDRLVPLRQQQATEAINALKATPKPAFSLGTWIEEPQRQTRETCYDYVRLHQQRHLLGDMRDVVKAVRERFGQWFRLLDNALTQLLLPREIGSGPLAEPLLGTVRRRIANLTNRLLLLAADDNALISLADRSARDITMQGFADELRRRAQSAQGTRLHEGALSRSRWEARVNAENQPALSLRIEGDSSGLPLTELRSLGEVLYRRFRGFVDTQLEDVDIFDYLLHVQRQHGIQTDAIAARLNQAAKVLLNVYKPGGCRWVFRQPSGQDKINLADALQGKLIGIAGGTSTVVDPIKGHTDRASITLLKTIEPERDEIHDIKTCLAEYTRMLGVEPGSGGAQDEELLRALVYHPFRAEAEAWFIERTLSRRANTFFTGEDVIPARIARLLDRPDFMRAFVHCVATGAVERQAEHRLWVWHAPGRNDPIELSDGDLVNAAVVFVLQQRERRQHGRIAVTLDAALDSARQGPRRNGGYFEAIEAFAKSDALDGFFDEVFPLPAEWAGNPDLRRRYDRERQSLKMIFQFYGDPAVKAELSARTLF